MRAPLATAVVTIALALISIASQHHTGVSTADGVCPAGSNWDNSIHACR